MTHTEPGRTFLAAPEETDGVRALYAEDVADAGFVMNASRVWGHRPELQEQLFALLSAAASAAGLSFRQRGVLVAATASARQDSYCSLAWGRRLAKQVGPDAAASVVAGGLEGLDERARALTIWARQVVVDPNATSPADVQSLRDVGLSDRAIFEATAHIAFRLAFSTVNDALAAAPDAQVAEAAPEAVRQAVTFGRPPDRVPS